ncbi:MAG: ATP-dependent helicase Lhr and Lhr-like helicase [Verrucomicrobiota bacterium]|jgi:ATP-dependent Lhr-like helicase
MQTFEFHPIIARWFRDKFGTPTPPQEQGWPAIQSGPHTLIAAPTGSGKTLAAFLCALDALFREGIAGELPDETRVLYVSPLKALSNDIHKNLEVPLAEIRAALGNGMGRDVHVRAAVRTGDTPASKRQAILRKPPHILVTTPESFYLLLTSVSGRKMLATVRTLIVDEIHAVVSNRRGSHLALSMERLEALTGRPVQRVGLSATQKPIEEVARFLVGGCAKRTPPSCTIVDVGHSRAMDVALELPGSPLEAVMSNEVWVEIYDRLVDRIESHQTTLIFVNTRRLAERVAHRLAERLGKGKVMSHHGSLSTALRLDAETRLKNGELKALVATSSLELGIDIGSVDLVCQVGTTRSIATFLQRIGRAGHSRGGLPKGRLFPLTRDELVESAALLRCVRRGELDRLHIPRKPLDVLSQQMVAAAACKDWEESELFDLMRSAYPYRDLARAEFDAVLRMLSEGFSTKRGRRGALIHHDAVNHRIRGRRAARLVALTSGGAIPDNADYRVVVEPGATFVGTVNEDFAVESIAGDIFQLGNTSWRILGVNSGIVRVADAQGQPPGIPFWLGEGPARTEELSGAVSRLRDDVERQLNDAAPAGPSAPLENVHARLMAWLENETHIASAAARQLADYFVAIHRTLGVIPSQEKIVLERFFDESGGMQLVIHSPFGARINRGWGLALRKRFCRSFNFELQAAATDDAIVLSLGTQHSFPLDEVFRYLNSGTVREILVQALLDAPMFGIRWRWNATRALALPRQRGGRRIPPPLQRMESENLLAAVFPDQLACQENIAGDREVPEHPLVRQTIEDCLVEAMDIEGLEALLLRIEKGIVRCIALDLPEPSPLAHEILNARPYAFLDDAPLEERRTQAVYTRRASDASPDGLGILDAAAIDRVCSESWPRAANADELHETLLQFGVVPDEEMDRCADGVRSMLKLLTTERRAGLLDHPRSFWVAAERLPLARAVYPGLAIEPPIVAPESESKRIWERSEAVRELVRGRIEIVGPVTAAALASQLALPPMEIDSALLALEVEGFVLRGRFHAGVPDLEWCDRRLLARIHRLTLNRLRAEIQPVSIADFQRFLLAWQRIDTEHQANGVEGLDAVLELLDGYELPAAAWEPDVLTSRVAHYVPQWLDQLCFTGRIGWGRLSPPQHPKRRAWIPLRSSPICLFRRENLSHWLALAAAPASVSLHPDTDLVLKTLARAGALFFSEVTRATGLLPSRVEQGLGQLAALGWVTSDSFEGLRALLTPPDKRAPLGDIRRRRRHKTVTSVEFAGRWSLLRRPPEEASHGGVSPTSPGSENGTPTRDEALEKFARVLLRRYGILFRRLLEREALKVSWYEMGRVLRRLEARGEIRGGQFVSGVSGEQFALPEAIGLLRSQRKRKPDGALIALSAADPLNLVGILTPGARLASISASRFVMRDGVPLAALVARKVVPLDAADPGSNVEQALKIGSMTATLRPYYA